MKTKKPLQPIETVELTRVLGGCNCCGGNCGAGDAQQQQAGLLGRRGAQQQQQG